MNSQKTILVVEDNADVRELACDMLEEAGFEVIVADNAVSGLQQFNSHANIDLVFSDVIMPGGVTGVGLAKEILGMKPDTQILLVTGYSEKANALLDGTQDNTNITCVQKPYDIFEIPKLINSLLEK